MTLSNHNKWLNYLYTMAIGVLIGTSMSSLAATKEEAVKAGSIYNFTKFAVWPNDISVENNFNLCVFSKSKPNEGLQALKGKLVAGKPLVLHHNINSGSTNRCHMAFIANDSHRYVKKTIKKMKGLPILTVSDSPDFINMGGMIGLIKEGKNVAFEVNILATNAVGISIGAQLLKLAERVEGLN